MANVAVSSFSYFGRLSRISSSSPWQMPVNASGKNTSSTFLAPRKSLRRDRLPVLVLEREVGGLGSDVQRHECLPGGLRLRLHQPAGAPVAEVGRRGLHQPRRRRRLGDLGGHARVLACPSWGEHPDDAVIGQRRDRVHQPVDEVAVVVAPPQQHHVDDLVGVLVEQLAAARVLDIGPDVVVDVVVPAQFLHDLIFLDAQPLGVVRGVCRRDHRRSSFNCSSDLSYRRTTPAPGDARRSKGSSICRVAEVQRRRLDVVQTWSPRR